MTDLLSSPRPSGGVQEHAADWSWLPDPADVPTAPALAHARDEAERLLADHGVTYGADRSDGDHHPWRLDPLPVTIDEPEWARLDTALVQRAELLDAILQDAYGPRRLLTDRMLPPTVVLGHPGFARAVDGLRLPGGRELVLTATDVVRDGEGAWCAVADRTQAPSGVGYAMEDRRVVAQVLSGVYRQASIQRLGPFFRSLRLALRSVAPGQAEHPRIVLLTSGASSETAFDQAYLASMLGLPLVEGPDLLVREGRVWMRGIEGLEPVDVILRRVDAEWCDPLDLRQGSRIGVPGLVRAVRAGAVSVVNPLGSSVLENPALLTYLPRLARVVLDQDLLLASAPTWWCGEERSLKHVVSRLDELVILPTVRGTDVGTILGWTLSHREREQLAARIAAEPWLWVGQEPVGPAGPIVNGTPVGVGSDLPASDGVGPPDLGPRAAVLRTYAVAHDGSYTVMAGGLARVAEGHVVSSALGAAAKDVWVLSSQSEAQLEPWAPSDESSAGEAAQTRRPATGISPRTAENLYWMGRYAERAEDTSRALRVVIDRWDDFHRLPASAGGRALHVLLEPFGEAPSLRDLVLDRQAVGTVARSIRMLGASAAAVRDQLSTDTFGPLGRIDRALRDERSRSRGRTQNDLLDLGALRADTADTATAGLRTVLDRVLEGLLAVAGIAAEGLVRDVGWDFLEAGRRIERAQNLIESLLASVVQRRASDVDGLVLESLLLAHESAITYRRRHQAVPTAADVLELLLHDRTNPRSLAFQLDRLREALALIPLAGRSPDQRDHLLSDVVDLLDELDTVTFVAATSDEGRRQRLAEALESMLWRLQSTADEIERVHFAKVAPSQSLEDPWDARTGAA
ncbi:circularly permuted type 2 ATP-grasp protein [Cellulomonas sp. URHE0023]|uniref:circularly permuted type 2 ATP-grasp protein n=1 Tax=Cellulomonas sp. URHE0023 TaxID=1380354 RepID=UPI0004899EEE|nr:circularly permuted type 2 ATP-grasp protein [Cellulomonas sp. URHE0023]